MFSDMISTMAWIQKTHVLKAWSPAGVELLTLDRGGANLNNGLIIDEVIPFVLSGSGDWLKNIDTSWRTCVAHDHSRLCLCLLSAMRCYVDLLPSPHLGVCLIMHRVQKQWNQVTMTQSSEFMSRTEAFLPCAAFLCVRSL